MDSISTHSAADPFLGISQLLEVTRVFGMLHKEGWTSQRSVVFALWDGEEQGILGSTEWVEENMAALRSRAVIYIGTKMLTGDKFHPMSSPAVSASVRGAASLVPHYKKKGKTLLDMWAADSEVEKNSKNRPMTWPVMGRSDDAPFAFSAGVPTAFLMFLYRHNITNLYPAYHTAYDTLELVEKYLDPKFRVSRMSVQLIASLVRLWADRRLLPYELRELAFHVRTGLDTFIIRHGSDIATHNLDMSAPLKAARYLSEITEGFMEWTMRIRRLNPLKIRIANDIMMEVEKLFINPGGIPTRDPTLRNLVFAPEGVLFPGIEDAITKRPFNADAFGLQTALLTEVICHAAQHLVVSPL
ncbi:putative N-acetylated-alpha-linked acidic dipeptidase [Ornithodoros turicata]|uniref:putative N-acetylated-alpha-linked acidic dipeptidase n=1 Tax=Ornithodoros turicata TaxID=34597 RepID=UPI003138E02F